MSTNTRNAQVAELLFQAAALLLDEEPAKVTPKARKAQPKADVKVARPATKGTKALRKATRKAFIAAAAKEGVDFAPVDGVGWSTKEIAEYCVAEQWAPKGFHIGEGYTALFS